MSKDSVSSNSTGGTNLVTVSAVDAKLRTALVKGTFGTGPPLANGFSYISLEKPGSFIIDYDVNKMDVRFKFFNSVRALDRDLQLTYSHSMRDNKVSLDGTLVIDPLNKLSMNYACGTGNCRLKYSCTKGVTTFEPCYDVKENAWDIVVSQKRPAGDVVRASYKTSNKVLTMEWDHVWKFAASVNLADEEKGPKLSFQKTWTLMEF